MPTWWVIGFPSSIWQAARKGNQEAVVVFVQRKGTGKVGINALDNKGRTPLDHAVHGKHKKLIKVMKDMGALPASKLPKPKSRTRVSKKNRLAATC